MDQVKSKLSNARQKLLRRTSQTSTPPSAGSDRLVARPASLSVSLTKLPVVSSESVAAGDAGEQRLSKSAVLPSKSQLQGALGPDNSTESTPSRERHSSHDKAHTNDTNSSAASRHSPAHPSAACPELTIEEPTPIHIPVDAAGLAQQSLPDATVDHQQATDPDEQPSELRPSPARAHSRQKPPPVIRRQSLVTTSNARIIKDLLEPDISQAAIAFGPPTAAEPFVGAHDFSAGMMHRKIWVKRPGASATLVQVREDDLVDDIRETILKKYANSLGKTFDAPDITLRIYPQDSTSKSEVRMLGPEEEMCRTLDTFYPGGQTINEALVIEVPQRKTPKPSPRIPVYYPHHDDSQPYEHSEYFPPMPVVNPSPAALTAGSHDTRASLPHGAHSIAVIQTGQLPPLPSPGSSRRTHHGRPRYPRHNTASPTTLTSSVPNSAVPARPTQRPRHDSNASETKQSASSGNAPIPTPPAAPDVVARQNATPPISRVASPRLDKRNKKQRELPSLPTGLLDNSVPPINVLIVEDNIINLRVLGAFMQRLKVRWQRAMNGKEAVTKWRAGGFHLVLMDIQLPVMNGLEATKEIRRLERANSIGVFSSGSSKAPNNRLGEYGNAGKELKEDDKLGDNSLFKSPVIIVALTASSLQSDRHEALAAGCNDFLTKPVNFVWLERKVKEWGCMQALIDFDGWRKWKDFAAAQPDTADSTAKVSTGYSSYASRPKIASHSPTPAISGPAAANGAVPAARPTEEDLKPRRRSLGVVLVPSLPEEESTGSQIEDADGS